MAYGDGGFFFTQPVGNGYSGVGALYGAARTSFSPMQGFPGGSSAGSSPGAGATLQRAVPPQMRVQSAARGRPVTSRFPCAVPGSACTVEQIQAEMARIAAIWARQGVTDQTSHRLWPTYSQLDANLQQLLAASASETPAEEPYTPPNGSYLTEGSTYVDPSTYTSYVDPSYPMPMLDSSEVPGGPATDYQIVSSVEEPEGFGGWVAAHPYLSAGIAATASFFAWRELQKRGIV